MQSRMLGEPIGMNATIGSERATNAECIHNFGVNQLMREYPYRGTETEQSRVTKFPQGAIPEECIRNRGESQSTGEYP